MTQFFFCNLCRNNVARQVSGRLQCIACSHSNLSCNIFGLQRLQKVDVNETFYNVCIDFLKTLQVATRNCSM